MKVLGSILAGALLVSGCAMMGPKLDAQRAKSVKTVAIIGYEIHQQQPTDNFGISAIGDGVKNGGVQNSPEFQEFAKSVYEDLSKKIALKTNWKVIPYGQLKSNKAYSQLVKSKMEGARMVSAFVDSKSALIPLNGLLDVYAFRNLTPEQKTALAADLGVDAIAEFTMFQTISQPMFSVGHLSGHASFEFTSRANLMVFAPNSTEPIWQIQNVDGTPVSSKSYPDSTPRLEKLSRVGTISAQAANAVLVENYKLY